MVLFRASDYKLGRVFSLGLLLLVTARISRQQDGVSLRFGGETLPSDSFVDLDDVLNIGTDSAPTNRNPGLYGAALECITDLVDCCGTEPDTPSGITPTVRGNWYFPDGTRVHELNFGGGTLFMVNRGPNEVINGEQLYGSVRLFRRFSGIIERGRFYCELPSAANPNVDHNINVNILNFGFHFNVDHVIISPSTGSTATTAGQRDYSLTCSSTLYEPSSITPQSGIPSPNFQWSFDGSTSLPSGVTAMPTVMSSTNHTSETYTSTLQISSLRQCHAGMYTCRLGPGRLVNSVIVTVNDLSSIDVSITTSGAKVLGQSGYSLICGVTANPSITYQWTKNNGTHQTQVGTDRVLFFSPLRLSDAGWYTCQATFSPCNITKMDTQRVTLQIPAPTSVSLSSSIPNPIPPFGSDVTLTCAVELSPAVDVPVTINTVLSIDEGFPRTSNAQQVMESITTNYTATFMISSFRRSDSGLYICRATVSFPYINAYISDSSTATDSLRVTTGVYLALRGVHIANNSNINIKSTGLSSDNPNGTGALQCTTDNRRCCSQDPRLGEWYQPNGALVQGTTSTTAFYRTRGANGEVSLNRPSGVESPTGWFCCEVPDATNTNQTLCANIVPEPIVSVHSDSPNHVFYEHPSTLICTVEISSVVTAPLSMTIVWKGPYGTVMASPTRPEMKSLTLYTSSSGQLTSVDSADSGEYTCTVRFENFGAEISASTNITIVDGVFQLRLKDVGICQQWYSESSDKHKPYSDFIKDVLVTAIKHYCKCHYPITNFNKDVFICEDSPPNFLIYRSSLLGTHNFNGTQIVNFIQDWVNTGPLIEVDGNSIRVDSSCPTAISSLDDPVCGEKEEKCSCDYNPKYAMCAQHLDDNNIANCFDGCVIRNG